MHHFAYLDTKISAININQIGDYCRILVDEREMIFIPIYYTQYYDIDSRQHDCERKSRYGQQPTGKKTMHDTHKEHWSTLVNELLDFQKGHAGLTMRM